MRFGDLAGSLVLAALTAAGPEKRGPCHVGIAAGSLELVVRLSRMQYRLLQILLANAEKVVTHHQLLSEVWGAAHRDDVRYLRVFIRKPRLRIEADPARPQYLLTELGAGYRLRAPDRLAEAS